MKHLAISLFFFCSILNLTARASGKPIVVAVLDSGLNYRHQNYPLCKSGHRDFSGEGKLSDSGPINHGTNIVSLVSETAGEGNYCLVILKIFSYSKGSYFMDNEQYYAALRYVLELQPAIINLSFAGENMLIAESILVKQILNSGITVVAAAGNEGRNFDITGCNTYPACIDNRIYVIGNSTSRTSNTGKQVDYRIDGSDKFGGGVIMTGTSQAAAIFTGKTIRSALNLQNKGY